MSEEFIKQNKDIILEEITSSLESMNAIVASNIQSDIDDPKALIALGYHIGNMTSLFNEFQYLYTEHIPIESEDRPIGFQSLSKEK